MMLRVLNLLFVSAMLWTVTGCAGFGQKLKSFLNGGEPEVSAPVQKPRFSQQSEYMGAPRRKYKRMTKEKMEQEAKLESRAGSLWVMEGQGAYLFSQNIIRMIGDPLTVRIEGDPRAQLEAKATTIRELLAKLEERRMQSLRAPANQQGGEGTQAQQPRPATPPESQKTETEEKTELAVKMVPTRIVERLVDGSYRIKGSQDFMLGSREYKVIVTGIVRAEDFTEEGISAAKLLDPNFDIVSVRKKESQL